MADAESRGRASVLAAGFAAVDYFEARDPATLQRLGPPLAGPARLFAAGRLGPTRLIDNVAA